MFKSRRAPTHSRRVRWEDIEHPRAYRASHAKHFRAAPRNGRLGPVLVRSARGRVLAMEAGDGAKAYRPVRSTRIGVDPAAIEEAAELLVEAAAP